MTAPHTELDGVVLEFVDHEEGAQILDRQARKYFNLSGEEFSRAYCAGELDSCNSDVSALSFLLGLLESSVMQGRTPTEAYFQFIEPIQQALNFVAVGRLLLGRPYGGSADGRLIDTSFNDAEPAPLRGATTGSLFLRVAFRCRIDHAPTTIHPFQCGLVGYSYGFLDADGRELLAFHWNSIAAGAERSFPHLHIGASISRSSTLLPGRLHKLHIPTGVIPVSAMVRFAIEELHVDVRPGLNREQVLERLSKLIDGK